MTAGMVLFDPGWVARAAGGAWRVQPSVPILRICHDTRRLQPGDLYVAIRGARLDGHRLVDEAFRKGAVAAMVDSQYAEESGGRSQDVGHALLVVPQTVAALGQLASVHRHRMGAWITGVTGSVGKTTVKDMIAALLGVAGETVRTQGNWNNNIGLPLSLLGLTPETRFGVFEAGMNHPGEIAPLGAMLSPDWGVVTAVGPVHIEFFENVEAIAEEKADLLRSLPLGGLAFLHADDPYFEILRSAAPCALRTLRLGDVGDADLLVSGHDGRMVIREGGQTAICAEIPIPVPGRHNLVNAGLAMLVARAAGLSWEQVRVGFDQYKQPPMRWEMQRCGSYTVINDAYNANPLSMRAALATFSEMHVAGRKWLVLGDMLELGEHAAHAHRELGRLVAQGDWAGLAAVGLHGQRVLDAAKDAGFDVDAMASFATAEDVRAWLIARLEEGDAILLKGSRGVRLEKVVEGLQVEC